MGRMRRAIARSPDREGGAAAVEFALVLPILIWILFGTIDYGLYFNASLQARWGVHDAARAASVAPDRAGPTSCGTRIVAPRDVTRLICAVLAGTDSATAKKYVDVMLPDGWVVGKQLVVCERLDVSGISGLVPMPGSIKDIAVVTIESDATDPSWENKTQPGQDYEDPLPKRTSWGWCGP